MKNHLYFILLISSLSLNAQNCFWGARSGDSQTDNGKCITTDLIGNVYVTGYFFSDTIVFGNYALGNNSNSSDLFIAKYNQSGHVLWAKSFGSGLDDEGRGITTDASNNIYVTGYFRGDSITLGNTTFYNQIVGYSDVFIIKLDPNGNVLWAKQGGNNEEDDISYAITTDATSVYVTGRFHSRTLEFDGITIQNSDTSGGSYDMFITKYSLSGAIDWVKVAGGTNDNTPNAITTYAGGVCITGAFNSDTMFFGSINLPNTSLGNAQSFIVRYDLNGIAQWAKSSRGTDVNTGYGITSDGSNIYLTGNFRSTSIFDTDTLHSLGSWFDIFLVKYSSSGNIIWAKSFGGSGADDMGLGMTTDNNGSIYVTGIFGADSVSFNNITIHNSNSSLNPPNSFITKFDSSGVALWSTSAGGSNYSRSIAVDGLNNVFITGYYTGNMTLINDTLHNSGSQDIFVAHPYSFNSSVTSTNNNCNGASNGSITLSISGGYNPITFDWSNGDSSSTLNNLPANIYSVIITDSNLCTVKDTIQITEPPVDSVTICMVTVDSLSQHNVIYWDKTNLLDVDSFIVYREIATNNYQVIARIPYDSLSAFIDTVSYLYFPNTGNPNIGTYRYKIQARDTCGGFTTLSPYHNTIYMVNNNGTFSWPQLYTIENAANPVTSYVLMRDDSSNGNWQAIGSVSGSQQTVSDPQYSIYQNIASWRVQTQWNISCTPTRSTTTSLSNLYNAVILNAENLIKDTRIETYPNPANKQITVYSNQLINHIYLYDIRGLLKFAMENFSSQKYVNIDISEYSKGVYILQVENTSGRFAKKIIIE